MRVLSLLTGAGLASAAGLNAWIPLLAMGLLGRYTEVVRLPAGWEWLTDGWILVVVTVLLGLELVADKIPGVDSVNDIVQTAIRPTSGGLVFGAGATSQTAGVTEPAELFADQGWVPVATGVLLALAVHLLKAAVRPVLNALTGCLAAPVVSTAENAASVLLTVTAILLPVLIIVLLAGLAGTGWWGLRRRRQRVRSASPAPPTPYDRPRSE